MRCSSTHSVLLGVPDLSPPLAVGLAPGHALEALALLVTPLPSLLVFPLPLSLTLSLCHCLWRLGVRVLGAGCFVVAQLPAQAALLLPAALCGAGLAPRLL